MIRKTEYYGSEEVRIPLEIYLPQDDSEKHPCLMFFYGGGFVRRNMDNFERQCEYYSAKGFICVNADYRNVNEVSDLKECYQDGFKAFARVLEISGEYGIDSNKIVLCGSSSGGALAAHISLITGKPMAQILINPGIAWQYDNVEYVGLPGTNTQQIIESEAVRHEPWEQAYYLLNDHDLIETLIIVGTHDEVCYRGSSLFHQKAREYGYPSKLVLIEGLEHGQMNYLRSENNFGYETALRKMDEFLEALNIMEG